MALPQTCWDNLGQGFLWGLSCFQTGLPAPPAVLLNLLVLNPWLGREGSRGSPQKTAFFLAASLYRGGCGGAVSPRGFHPGMTLPLLAASYPRSWRRGCSLLPELHCRALSRSSPRPGLASPIGGPEETWGHGAAPRPLTASVGPQLSPCLSLRPVASCRLACLGFRCPGERLGLGEELHGEHSTQVPHSASPPPREGRTHPREPLGSSHTLEARGWDPGVPARSIPPPPSPFSPCPGQRGRALSPPRGTGAMGRGWLLPGGALGSPLFPTEHATVKFLSS